MGLDKKNVADIRLKLQEIYREYLLKGYTSSKIFQYIDAALIEVKENDAI